MNTFSRIAPLALLILPLLGACQRQEQRSATAAPPAASTTTAPAPETMLGKTVDTALRKARDELETGNIDISRGVDIETGKIVGTD